ncbi:solute carrier family 23 protein, partial [Streptomyces sp. NPDC005921]
MTATPRLWEASPGSAGADETGGRLVASMDDEQLYGPVLFEFGLMESVERGVLARFEIDVLEIRDPQAPGPDASVEERRGRRLAALQEALLKHADTTGVRSFMTFHSRTLDAMAFARALPETAAELHATDPVTYPGRVGAEWLSGEHPVAHRRVVLDRFADGIDADGWVTDLGVLSNCRVLGEGVDIRGKRGVGAVVFADTRSSPVEIVQIIGRGLRQNPGEGKISRIIVPVFLEPGEDPSDMMASPSYRPLVAVLQGLRAHDARVIERLTLATTTARGQATSVVALDPVREEGDQDDDGNEHQEDDTDDIEAAADTEDGTDEETAQTAADETGDDATEKEHPGANVPLLRFSLPRDPGTVALFLRTRVLHPDSEIWLTGYNALRTWVRETGDAQVPLDASVELMKPVHRRIVSQMNEMGLRPDRGYVKCARAGLLGFVLAPYFCKLVRFFPPVVTGTVITLIGVSLLPVAFNWSQGGNATADDYGSTTNITMAAVTLVIVLALRKLLRGFL